MRTSRQARSGWPQVLDTMPPGTVSALTGINAQDLAAVRVGRLESPGAIRRLHALAAAARHPEGSLVIEHELLTFPRLGTALVGYYAEQTEQWPALLRQVLRHAGYLTSPADVDLLFLAPTVRDQRVLAVLGATAALACHRLQRSAPDWTAAFLPQPWDVLDEGTTALESPLEFASRGVLLHARHLSETSTAPRPREPLGEEIVDPTAA